MINSITVRNILGAVVKSVSVSSLSDVIDLRKEDRGIYLIEIKTTSGIITKKLIVE